MNNRIWKKYYICWIGILGLMIFILNAWKTYKYSDELVEELISKKLSSGRLIAEVCNFQTAGDPTEPNKLSIKLELHCKNGKVSVNTLSTSTLSEQTVLALKEKVAGINGFKSDLITYWKCRLDGRDIENNLVLKAGNNIVCYE